MCCNINYRTQEDLLIPVNISIKILKNVLLQVMLFKEDNNAMEFVIILEMN